MDRIVYVHPDHTSSTTTIITPKSLDALLEEEWAVKEQSRKKVDGKVVDVYHLYKPSKERGLSVRDQEQPQRNDMGLAIRPQVSGERSMALSNNRSFLGDSDFHGLPGVQVATSKLIQHAYSMGADAANEGKDISACPWKPGHVAATQWLKGFYAGGGKNGGTDTSDALAAGKLAGKGDPDLEVHCPYPAGTPHYKAWITGFKEAGGKVV